MARLASNQPALVDLDQIWQANSRIDHCRHWEYIDVSRAVVPGGCLLEVSNSCRFCIARTSTCIQAANVCPGPLGAAAAGNRQRGGFRMRAIEALEPRSMHRRFF